MKNNKLLWCLSLIMICICSLIWAGARFLGMELPDAWIRAIGILDLVCVAVLAYTSVKKKKK